MSGRVANVTACKQPLNADPPPNCHAHFRVPPAVNPCLVDHTSHNSCPVAEKCNRLDDDPTGSVPTNESDLDGDHYTASGTPCAPPLKAGLIGCGDCQDSVGTTNGVDNAQIHPDATELCNNVNDDCDIACNNTG